MSSNAVLSRRSYALRSWIVASTLMICLLWMLGSNVAYAASLRISPVSLDLPSTQRAASISLVNTSSEPVNLQLRVFKWSQTQGKDVLDPTTDLLVSPPAATIPPGASYTVRVARPTAAPVVDEMTYRLLIDELPKPVDPRTVDQGVAMVLRTSIPVFIVDKSAVAQLAWQLWRDSDGLHAEVANTGNRHAKIIGLAVNTSTGKLLSFGSGLNGYVLPGSRKRFDLAAKAARVLVDGEQVTLTGRDQRLPIKEVLRVQAR